MGRNSRKRRNIEEDTELNMVPIMNMFMVLIPFLLMSASFYHIKAINTSVPVHADTTSKRSADDLKKEKKITMVVELKTDEVRISALCADLSSKDLAALEKVVLRSTGREIHFSEISGHLAKIKEQYPASDTMILIPDDSILYDDIVQAMDCARKTETRDLFPNVVISGSLG
jgi:biopolymer transport protein ExbD